MGPLLEYSFGIYHYSEKSATSSHTFTIGMNMAQRRRDQEYSYRGLWNIQKKHAFYQKFKLSII